MKHNYSDCYRDIILHPMTHEDSEDYRILRNREENRKWFANTEIISSEMQSIWYQNYLNKEGNYMFAAFHTNHPEMFIGAVSIYDICQEEKQAEFGRIIVDKTKILMNGIGYQIAVCACKIGFHHINLEKLHLEVFSDNIPAIKTYEKIGFNEKHQTEKDGKTLIYMELDREKFLL